MIKDLTNGSIIKNLLKVSIPVMAASLFQMAYQIIDMFWLGRLSSSSVAAVGTAGFYIGISSALATLAFIGIGIKISHCVGKRNFKKALEYVLSSLFIIIILSIMITGVILLSRNQLIGFFNISSPYIESSAIKYLSIVILFSIFTNINMTFNSIFIGYGSGKIPLLVGSFSLLLNIALDPIFIFTLGFGVVGAAYATVIAQVLSTTLYLIVFIKSSKITSNKDIKVKFKYVQEIIKLSYPVTIQRFIFVSISIFIGKTVSNWGMDVIAVQKIGLQLESISWITAAGMQSAISSFIGQNYGAKKFGRLSKGYGSAILIMVGVGTIVSLLFLLLPQQIFSLFVKEESVISGGVIYLRIIGISQIFMCIDITTMGAFNGIGKTGIPPIISVTLTSLRVPLAIFLSSLLGLGVIGVWISISLTTIVKGILIASLFVYYLKKIVRSAEIE